MGSYPRAPSLALRAIHLVPPYIIQFVKWFNVYTIMITIYRRAGWPYPAVCKFSCTIKIVGEHIVLPHNVKSNGSRANNVRPYG